MTLDRPTELSVFTHDSVRTPLVQPKPGSQIHPFTAEVFLNAYYVQNCVSDTVKKVGKKRGGETSSYSTKGVVYIFAKQGKHPQADRSLVKTALWCLIMVFRSLSATPSEDVFNYIIYGGSKKEYFQHAE